MATALAPTVSAQAERPRPVVIRPGDLVTTRTGYPILYEVLTVEADGLMRVRGLNWAPGYSAVVAAHEVRPVTGILNNSTAA